ncbi:TetR/AcrR family transcriptional regulator, partial [Mycobacterium sp. 1245852.3]|uniref:TetR/AcrR family transcriptional regulator n=1 Tax=Mycobacterium sp. 1245852.3 TaxID=1856860 RepID=UPI000A8CBA8F
MAHPDVHGEQRLTAKGRATRDRIVQAAAELIVTKGLSAFNMDGVRRAASVSGSQLAHYFADKATLIRAVIRRQIGVVLDFHRQPTLRGLGSFDDFERWIDLNMRYLRRIGYFGTPTYHALTAQLAKSDDATREALAAGYRQWIDLLEQAIARMKDDGLLVRDADPHQLALVIVAAHQGGGEQTQIVDREANGVGVGPLLSVSEGQHATALVRGDDHQRQLVWIGIANQQCD